VQIRLAFCAGVVIAIAGLTLSSLQFWPLTGSLLSAPGMMGIFCAVCTLSIYFTVSRTSAKNVSQYHYTSYWPADRPCRTQYPSSPASPADEAYARFSICRSAAPLARLERRFPFLILTLGI